MDPLAIQPEELPLGDRIVRPGTFASLVSELAPLIDGGDDMLAGAGNTIAPVADSDLDAAYALTVGGAEAAHAGNVGAIGRSPAGDYIDAGDDVEGLRQSVIAYLPPPETEIPADIDAPPNPADYLGPPEVPGPPVDPSTGCPIGWIVLNLETCQNPDNPDDIVSRQPTA